MKLQQTQRMLPLTLLTFSKTLCFHHTPLFCGKLKKFSQLTKTQVLLSTSSHELKSLEFQSTFSTAEEYQTYLSTKSQLPQGFRVGTATGTFISSEAPNMGKLPIRATVVSVEIPTLSWTACFTKNKFPGAPVMIGRDDRLLHDKPLQAIVINNKISNVCSPTGVQDSNRICDAVAQSLNLPNGFDSVIPCSTGIIGWKLPVEELTQEIIPNAVENLKLNQADALDMAKSIMTTDRFPKLRSKTLSSGAKIVGIAKGAGMIEPNMATMLSYFLTDAKIDVSEKEEEIKPSTLKPILQEAIDDSFNCISVDSDESTSDTAILVSSSKIPSNLDEFQVALKEITRDLATDVVRNGEGTGHVLRITIQNYSKSNLTKAQAKQIGKKIVNSPLMKCAIAGNDPNIGRLASAIGSYLGKIESNEDEINVSNLVLTLGQDIIFSEGCFVLDNEKENRLSDYLKDAAFEEDSDYPPHEKYVDIVVDFSGDGDSGYDEKVVIWGSDLTAEYVSINSDYRS